MWTFTNFALSLPPSTAHCVYASFFLYLLGVSQRLLTQLATRSFLEQFLHLTSGVPHSCFLSLLWVLLFLLRAKRALQLSTGASSSVLIPWVISFGSETLTFYLQPGLSPSTPPTLFCFFMSPSNVTCPKWKSWFHFHRPCFLPIASSYQQTTHSSCCAPNLAVTLDSFLHSTSSPLANLLALPSKNPHFHCCFSSLSCCLLSPLLQQHPPNLCPCPYSCSLKDRACHATPLSKGLSSHLE